MNMKWTRRDFHQFFVGLSEAQRANVARFWSSFLLRQKDCFEPEAPASLVENKLLAFPCKGDALPG